MTSSIYEVLKTGGLQVENWIRNAKLLRREEVVLGSEAETERGLGTVWIPEDGMLTFEIKMVLAPDATQSNNPKLTNRILLINWLVTAVLIKLKVLCASYGN